MTRDASGSRPDARSSAPPSASGGCGSTWCSSVSTRPVATSTSASWDSSAPVVWIWMHSRKWLGSSRSTPVSCDPLLRKNACGLVIANGLSSARCEPARNGPRLREEPRTRKMKNEGGCSSAAKGGPQSTHRSALWLTHRNQSPPEQGRLPTPSRVDANRKHSLRRGNVVARLGRCEFSQSEHVG
jgi:hypothetical protein